ncbi:RNA polymerase-associated protein RapA [Corynebacterium provencense]|uniref:RNA polymerase-associated protein RapA n=2 Tax=Corynebacterium provencense TaxID=1737425 RepID=A0A2Z3YUU2_9CORY|nr:RNA polymerase-associated protein RapA [Corynebacterium provencense]
MHGRATVILTHMLIPADAQLSPGSTIEVRDEEWLVTGVARSTDGWRVRARGLTDYVRDQPATFFTALDTVRVTDPRNVRAVADDSEHYRRTRLWLETTLRQTPVPLYQPDLAVAGQMLADPLDYQLSAVRRTLSDTNIRPRVLIADAVGLGKTLEMGMILAELIRRGRGERILVITPKHVLEQMQHELWCRFAIPLVRLDSLGIQKVRQKLPASRNPFTFFPRVIVSIDTLKSPKYRAQLEKVTWDAVVIDEVHNATNAGTQNNELAKIVAKTTEALVLASATPHNGNPDSFKEILRLLDPTSVRPDGTIDDAVARRLIIRRHRNSPEVAAVVGEKWAARTEPQNIPVEASDEENAVARELSRTWVTPETPDGKAPGTDPLFSWTLVKAFLSSPAALGETLDARLARIGGKASEEKAALQRLQQLNDRVTPENSNKYATLVDYLLNTVRISNRSPERVVVFSERVPTLHWLQRNLVKDLKLREDAVAVMHGGLSDQEQMRLIDSFKREDSPIRVLVTGDVASEGVNLHQQCHQLVHYDIPWSLIRIQQRNGRIDRYGQTRPPVITTLLLDPEDEADIGDIHVFEKLMERENQAHQAIGDVSSLMGEYSTRGEEDKIRDVLRRARDFDEVVHTPDKVASGDLEDMDDVDAFFADLDLGGPDSGDADTVAGTASGAASGIGTGTGATGLYTSDIDYLDDALHEAFHDVPESSPAAGGVDFSRHSNGVTELTPPKDLRRRLDLLPQDYLAARNVLQTLTLATTKHRGGESLDVAREGGSGSTWPQAHFLGPLHPVLSWAADRALSSAERHSIPAVTADVEEPTVLLMGTLTNRRGQVVSRAFVTVAESFLGMQPSIIPDPVAWLTGVGLTATSVNTGATTVPANAQELISTAVGVGAESLKPMMAAAKNTAEQRIAAWSARAEEWEAAKLSLHRGTRTLIKQEQTIAGERKLADALSPDRELIRPLALILPCTASTTIEGF